MFGVSKLKLKTKFMLRGDASLCGALAFCSLACYRGELASLVHVHTSKAK